MNMTYERIQQCNNVTMCTFNNVKCPYIHISAHILYVYYCTGQTCIYTVRVKYKL